MTKKPALPENHHRSLSTTAHMVEETLDRLESLLALKGVERLTSTVRASYSDEERQQLLRILSKMRKVNEDLVREFSLSKTESDESRIVRASITHLWTILVDSTSKGMKGFGPLPPDVAVVVDRHIGRLLAVVEEFFDASR